METLNQWHNLETFKEVYNAYQEEGGNVHLVSHCDLCGRDNVPCLMSTCGEPEAPGYMFTCFDCRGK